MIIDLETRLQSIFAPLIDELATTIRVQAPLRLLIAPFLEARIGKDLRAGRSVLIVTDAWMVDYWKEVFGEDRFSRSLVTVTGKFVATERAPLEKLEVISTQGLTRAALSHLRPQASFDTILLEAATTSKGSELLQSWKASDGTIVHFDSGNNSSGHHYDRNFSLSLFQLGQSNDSSVSFELLKAPSVGEASRIFQDRLASSSDPRVNILATQTLQEIHESLMLLLSQMESKSGSKISSEVQRSESSTATTSDELIELVASLEDLDEEVDPHIACLVEQTRDLVGNRESCVITTSRHSEAFLLAEALTNANIPVRVINSAVSREGIRDAWIDFSKGCVLVRGNGTTLAPGSLNKLTYIWWSRPKSTQIYADLAMALLAGKATIKSFEPDHLRTAHQLLSVGGENTY